MINRAPPPTVSRLLQPYEPKAESHAVDREDEPCLPLPDIRLQHYRDLARHREFRRIQARFLGDIKSLGILSRGYTGNEYCNAVQEFYRSIENPSDEIQEYLIPLYRDTRNQIHRLLARIRKASTGSDSHERDRIGMALHMCLNEIDLCQAGIHSRFDMATRYLETDTGSLDGRLYAIRKTLYQNFVSTVFEQLKREKCIDPPQVMEVHWFNSLYNIACQDHGLKKLADPFANGVLTADIKDRFLDELPYTVNEYRILSHLAAEVYQGFITCLKRQGLEHMTKRNVLESDITFEKLEPVDVEFFKPLNELCHAKGVEKINFQTLIEDYGNGTCSFVRAREKLQGWLTQVVMKADGKILASGSVGSERLNFHIGSLQNLFFWVCRSERLHGTGSPCAYISGDSEPLQLRHLAKLDLFTWSRKTQLAILLQALEQTEDAREVAEFLLGDEMVRQPPAAQKMLANVLSNKMVSSRIFSTIIEHYIASELKGRIPEWMHLTPLPEPVLKARRARGAIVSHEMGALSPWALLIFRTETLQDLCTPELGIILFNQAFERELGGLLTRLLHTGFCDCCVNKRNEKSQSLLMILIRQGYIEGVRYLLEQGRADTSHQDAEGRTALHFAAQYGQKQCLQLLLSSDRVVVEVTTNNGWTPLHFAVQGGYGDCLELLLARSAENLNQRTDRQLTPLHLAARFGHGRCLNLLLRQRHIEVNSKYGAGWTPLHLSAYFGHNDCTYLLVLEDKVEVNCQTQWGNTALSLAAANGHIRSVEYLLMHPQTRLISSGIHTFSARTLAQRNGHTEIVNLLNRDPRPASRFERFTGYFI